MRPHPRNNHPEPTEHREVGKAPEAGEVRLPRQRDTRTHRPDRPSPIPGGGDAVGRARAGNARLAARSWRVVRRVLVRVLAWLGAAWRHWVTYWPELAYLLIVTRALTGVIGRVVRRARRRVRVATGSVRRRASLLLARTDPVLRRWARAVAGLVRQAGPVARRCAGPVGAAARWCWTGVLCPAALATGRAVRRAGVWCWRRVEPHARDGAGWLVHTAPGLAGRALLRVAGWAPGALARLVRHAVLGAGWLLARLGRYCLAYPEYAGVVREARDLDRPRRARAAIVAWRRSATRRTTTTLIVLLSAGVGVWWLHRTHGPLAVALVWAGLLAVLAGVGRAVRPLPEPEPGENPSEPGQDEPYPIADAHTRAEAADCVRRALAAEGTALRLAGEARRTRWGWEVAVILRSGTPGGIVSKTAELETHLDLPAGGLLVTPDRARRARVVLRLAERDPFTGLGPPPTRTPAATSITERAVIGQRIDGTPLAVPLLGVHTVVIGTSGAGKSTTLRTLADAITNCADALVWDLDPAGCGLDALGPAVARRERHPGGITAALADALAVAEARPRMLAELGMGPAWQPSPDRPALVVMVDEYPSLPEKAKTLAVALLRIGRKARVTLLLAATEATSDALGAAIADTTALRILHACRHTDVRLVLGPQMLAEGWRPDRLHPATADDPGDAGHAYIATAGNREPLISAIYPLSEADAYERGARRAAAGLPRIDPASWAAARTTGTGGASTTTDIDSAQPAQGDDRDALMHALTVLAVFSEDDRLWTEELLARLAVHDPATYTGWDAEHLSGALRRLGITPVQVWRNGRNRRGYHRTDITAALGDDQTPGSGS